ncbi:hypothetical protein D9M72_557300 [compost metagenome]
MYPLWARSSSTLASVPSVCCRRTPPTRSAAFSLSASQRARCDDAPLVDSTYTDEPLAARFSAASAWIEMKMSALAERAFCARIGSGMNTSVSRVRNAFRPGVALTWRASSRATASVMSFSRLPVGPTAPGSWPP